MGEKKYGFVFFLGEEKRGERDGGSCKEGREEKTWLYVSIWMHGNWLGERGGCEQAMIREGPQRKKRCEAKRIEGLSQESGGKGGSDVRMVLDGGGLKCSEHRPFRRLDQLSSGPQHLPS